MAEKEKELLDEDNIECSTNMLIEDPEAEERKELEARTNELISNMRKSKNVWGLSHRGQQGVKLAMAGLSMTNGLYSRVPLVCKGEECPYASMCPSLPYGEIEEGGYCIWEIAQIEIRSLGYSQDIDYDSASFTDKALLSELIMLDIMLERCKALLAKDGTPVIDMAIGIDSEGNEVRQPAVSKAWEAYEKVSKKRDQTYQLLMLTRKDKKSLGKDEDTENLTDELKNVIDAMNVSV